MRRLEYSRQIRTMRTHVRNRTEAVMVLARVSFERHRLQQEQHSLEKRMKRIAARLTEIAAAETKLTPMIRPERQAGPDGPVIAAGHTAALAGAMTLQY